MTGMISLRKFYRACLPSRNERFLWGVVSVVTLVIVAVNALSILTEAARRGDSLDARTPWITEATSAVFIILLFPLVSWFVRRLTLDAAGMKKAVIAHLGLSIAFSAIHVAGMVGLRKLIFWGFFDSNYSFLDVVWRDALYEYRKDVVTYIMFVSLLYLVQALVRREEALQEGTRQTPDKRLAFKSGSELIWIKPCDFLYAKAAGNYVELYTANAMHLVRLSMTGLERQLTDAGVNVIRIHRSFTVNAECILSVKPKSDGDAEVVLQDGSKVPASRRYRAQLSALGG
ncbi:transcriptional regulator, LytTR family /response regulator receiver protein [Kordiimonas lacus]|uniref:Transcriptional regulator, LytTR family /response regulator receiver protein n=2 Tax=Kordiimonas lacus TaxID=637679 RepID=A0A1G6YFK5_9PROT|nr:transcriptional regulator, LytTR family /response regulator receiver protein [Kordiimonas lacus]